MADKTPVQADGAGTLDKKNPEPGTTGAGESGGGAYPKPEADKGENEAPDEDPQMGVAMDNG